MVIESSTSPSRSAAFSLHLCVISVSAARHILFQIIAQTCTSTTVSPAIHVVISHVIRLQKTHQIVSAHKRSLLNAAALPVRLASKVCCCSCCSCNAFNPEFFPAIRPPFDAEDGITKTLAHTRARFCAIGYTRGYMACRMA
jgi:hypothetical protein